MGRLISRGALVLLAIAVGGCGPSVQPTSTPQTFTPTSVASVPATEPGPIGPPTPGPQLSPGGIPSAGLSPTPSAATSSPPAGSAWQLLTSFPVGAAFEVTSVVAVAVGFVAVGFEALPGEGFFGRRQGVVWSTQDGVNWQRAADPAFQFVTPQEVIANGDSLYVLGHLATCPQTIEIDCTDVPEAGYNFWRSTASGPWERLPQVASMQHGLIDGVVVAGDRLAVFGFAGDEEATTTLWLSVDGTSWTETQDLAGLEAVSAMTAAGSGFVAFGTVSVPGLEDIEGRAAFSTDGIHFAPVEAPPLPGAAVEDVVGGSAGFVAVGYGHTVEAGLSAMALHSADGTSWTQATDTDGTFAGNGLLAVHALPNGNLGLGYRSEDEDLTRLIGWSWFSADGQSWTAFQQLGGPFSQFHASATGATGAVVFAADQQELEDENVTSTIMAWFAPPESLPGN